MLSKYNNIRFKFLFSFLKYYNIKSQFSFTLAEILITIAIVAVLSTAVILTLNPAEIIKSSRDSRRLEDLQKLNKAISWFETDIGGKEFMGTSSIVYVSIPDSTSTCANLGLPTLPSGWSYRCVSSLTLQNIDGTGWIPINFNKISFGRTLSKLPIDPVNNTSTYYSYTYNSNTRKYELNTILESQKQKSVASNDGGDNDNNYEVGSYLTLNPSSSVFVKAIGGANSDRFFSIIQTSDGGYIAGGDTYSYGVRYNDGFIIKFNLLGNIQWLKTIGGANSDRFFSIIQTSDGGYIAGGDTDSYGAGAADAFIIKLDSSGNIQWSKAIGGTYNDYISSISQTSDGGYIAGGYTDSYGYGAVAADAFIIKLDSSGNIQWSKAIGGLNYDYLYSIYQTSDGGYIAGGNTYSYGAGRYDAFIIKLDSSGNIQWSKTIGGTNDDFIRLIYQTSDGGYIAGGNTYSYGAGAADAFIIKLDSSGNIQWSKTIGGTNDDFIRLIYQTSDGGYIAGGYTDSYGAGRYDAFIIKLDSSGNIQWSKAIGGTYNDYISSISQTSDGGYIAGGYTDSYSVGYEDFFIIKLNSLGNVLNCSAVQSINPQISSPSPTVNSVPPTINSISPTINSISSTVSSPSPTVTGICPL